MPLDITRAPLLACSEKEGLLHQLLPRSTNALEHLLILGVPERCWQLLPEDLKVAEQSKNEVIPW